MSEYADIKTQFKSLPALLAALQETGGWTREQIETHDTPQHLFGYMDDQREQTANVIIRRQNVGAASNDIGFSRGADGSYSAVISAYDGGQEYSRYGKAWQGRLKQSYAYHAIRLQQQQRGRTVNRTTDAQGRMIVTVGGIR